MRNEVANCVCQEIRCVAFRIATISEMFISMSTRESAWTACPQGSMSKSACQRSGMLKFRHAISKLLFLINEMSAYPKQFDKVCAVRKNTISEVNISEANVMTIMTFICNLPSTFPSATSCRDNQTANSNVQSSLPFSYHMYRSRSNDSKWLQNVDTTIMKFRHTLGEGMSQFRNSYLLRRCLSQAPRGLRAPNEVSTEYNTNVSARAR